LTLSWKGEKRHQHNLGEVRTAMPVEVGNQDKGVRSVNTALLAGGAI
jgi:hypothetical protein